MWRAPTPGTRCSRTFNSMRASRSVLRLDTRRRRVGDHLRGQDRAARRQVAAQPHGGTIPATGSPRPRFVCRPQLRRGDVAARHHPARPRRLRQTGQPGARQPSSAGQEAQIVSLCAIAWRSWRSATSNSVAWPRQAAPCRSEMPVASSSSNSAITRSVCAVGFSRLACIWHGPGNLTQKHTLSCDNSRARYWD